MSKNKIFLEIERRLKENGDSKFAKSRNRKIKRDVLSYGVKVPLIRRVTKDYLNSNPFFFNSQNCLEEIEELLSNDIFDVQMTGIFLAASLNKSRGLFDQEDLLNVYHRWIESYIKNWAICDTFGTEVLSPALQENDQSFQILNSLSVSESRWARRISLVSLIKAKGRFKNWNKVLDLLLPLYIEEKDPLVKKAILWAKG